MRKPIRKERVGEVKSSKRRVIAVIGRKKKAARRRTVPGFGQTDKMDRKERGKQARELTY